VNNLSNHRAGVDAGFPLFPAFGCPWTGTTQHGRWASSRTVHFKHHIFLILSLALSCEACQAAPAITNDSRIISLALYDSGFFGGRDLFILSNRVALARVERPPQKSESGMQEQRFKIQLVPSDLAKLREVLNAHHFSTITVKERNGIPDERRTLLRIRFSDGQRKEVAKWAADAHQDFDPIYEHLLGIVKRAQKTQPVYEGTADYKWEPEGFE
jgi:hypothetical protein